jgi:nitrile hydratase accessory protein
VSDLIPEARQMDGVATLPRDNGELVFEAPWQGRVLAIAVGLVEKLDVSWEEFRARLVDAIAEHPDRPYYESWTAALEALVIDLDIAQARELSERAIASTGESAGGLRASTK